MSSLDAATVLQALLDLNQLEVENAVLGPRSSRKEEIARIISQKRSKVPPYVLSHHDRIRARGKKSTMPVKDWVCRGCFISVPVGLRSKLLTRDDIVVCENCGSYIYVPTPEQEADLQKQAEQTARRVARQELAAKREVTVKKAPAKAASVRKVSPKAKTNAKRGTKAKPAKAKK